MAGQFGCLRPYIGIGICAFSALCGGIVMASVKYLNHIDPFLLSTVRYWVMFLIATPITVTKASSKTPWTLHQWILLILRAIGGVVILMTNYFSVQHLPLADATVIAASSPMFTVIFAWLFIKESIAMSDVLNVVLVFIGIVLIAKPPFLFGASDLYSTDPLAVYAVIAMIIANALLQSCVNVLSRALKDIHWTSVMSALATVGLICTMAVLFIFDKTCMPYSAFERGFIIVVALISFLNQVGIVLLYQFETAGTGAMLRDSFSVLYAFLFQIFLFKEIPGWLSIFGALLIFLAILSSGMKKALGIMDQNARIKQLRFFKVLFSLK